MTMPPYLRKFVLTAHITTSVGWLGAVCAYLALAIAGLTTNDAQLAQAAYLSMYLMGWYVIVPLSFGAMLAGFVQSLATRWGLLRHYWIVTKLVLSTVATIVLLKHMTTVGEMANIARSTTLGADDFRELRTQLVVHPAGGLLVLLVATVLSVYKPWALTPFGRRTVNESETPARVTSPARGLSPVRTPRWAYVVGIHAVGLTLLALVLHLAGGGLRIH